MTWQELPVWCKLRMLINQMLQCKKIDPSVFIKSICASKESNGFNFTDAIESYGWWFDLLNTPKDPLPQEDPFKSKLYIYESAPNKYGLRMSHSAVYLYFSKQELSDLGLPNPIVEPKGSCKYHTFKEHLNQKESYEPCTIFEEWARKYQPVYESDRKITLEKASPTNSVWMFFSKKIDIQEWISKCKNNALLPDMCIKTGLSMIYEKYKGMDLDYYNTLIIPEFMKYYRSRTLHNPECIAFKEWALKQPSLSRSSLWEEFLSDLKGYVCYYDENYWIQRCNEETWSSNILCAFFPKDSGLFNKWMSVWSSYMYKLESKSPAKIFIEWALTQPYNEPEYESICEWYLRACHKNITKEKFVEKYKNSSLDTIFIDGMNEKSIPLSWINYISKNWKTYLKSINYENQLQREENPVTGSTGTTESKIHLEVNIFDCSRSCYRNGEGYRISRNKINISENKLSFGCKRDC